MPKGMEIRRPEPIEMHATLVNIPEGADVLQYLNKAADQAGYLPTVILSGIGLLSKGRFRVPNDSALDELKDPEKAFGIKMDNNWEKNPHLKEKTFVVLKEDTKLEDLPPDFPQPPKITPKPHWSTIECFNYPLRVLYAHGGRRRETSMFRYHFVMSGSPERPGGISESFVGEVLPGCVAKEPTQFLIGLSAPRNSTVQAWTVSIQPGYDVIDRLEVFLKARQNIGDCFIFSASGGKLKEAHLKNINAAGNEEFDLLRAEDGPYTVEGMTGILNSNIEHLRIHAAIVLNCSTPPCDAAGGELMSAIVDEGQPLDIYLGEIVEEQDLAFFQT